ncbi:hypothetical protein [Streptomyces sp. t39]|uniref:hypothetical protein n=1 Tax=Streptomyces sp. t39 TaxID=1828156 RepID=UPI0011CEA1F2|nr:hypothetical protein [Streptomyces sp. t39]TXS35101.1 hypothetical protein EAO77_38045 [Streptomyces sp. t39]
MSAREELYSIAAQDMPVTSREVREALDAYRAEVLREAADAVDSGNTFPAPVRNGASWAARMLRRMADAAEQACTCGRTACESDSCDCDCAPCPVDHASDEPGPVEVGQRYIRRGRPPRTVTVNRVWVDTSGQTAVAYEWRDAIAGQRGSALRLELFRELFRLES